MKRVLKLGCIFIAAVFIITVMPLIMFQGMAESAALEGPDAVNDTEYISKKTEKLMKEGMILFVGSPFAYLKGVREQIDPSDTEIAPVIKENVRMAPLRFIAESFGARVEWDQQNRTARVVMQGNDFSFKQGSKVMKVNGTELTLDIAVQEVKGRTFVPLNKIVDILEKKTFFDRGLIIITDSDDVPDPVRDKSIISALIIKMSYLPRVGSHERFIELMNEALQSNNAYSYDLGKFKSDLTNGVAVNEAAASESERTNAQMAKKEFSNDAADEYSTTNIQVQGVDEADVVKTDGEYIYQVNKQRVIISKAYPGDKMKVLSILNYGDENFAPAELYLHKDKLIVIGATRGYIPLYKNNGSTSEKRIYPPPQIWNNTVKALIYDASNRESIKKLREVELEGNYVSSRKIDSSIYMVVNKHIDYYQIKEGQVNTTPSYRDTITGDEYKSIDYNSICYFPGTIQPDYLMVAGIDIDGNEDANVDTYLGAGQNIYASADNLYIAVSGWRESEITLIYKFALAGAKVTYLCKGEVPGTILNQFSMDESSGYFRIATTKGNMWRTGEGISQNNLYILDDVLSLTGRVEGMAPGERIYSVRFMGDRAYVVTFKTVDPLFVIDLKDPSEPAILGALKIPGYSDYLHPYDENHIIGFGKDTVEMKGQAYYQGMKIALFDVTDVNNPVQKFSEIIGDRGTDSELLRNHKALLFSKEKNLLVFPVTLMEIENEAENVKRQMLEYGEFTFQGAYVYNLDPVNGFKLKGRITHLSDEDYIKAGRDWYDSDKNISRILYIGDTLYTLSESKIKANTMEDLKECGELELP